MVVFANLKVFLCGLFETLCPLQSREIQAWFSLPRVADEESFILHSTVEKDEEQEGYTIERQ